MALVFSDGSIPPILGCRIYYGDGSTAQVARNNFLSQILLLPSVGIQAICVIYDKTYQVWHGDHFDVEYYKEMFYSGDYYWWSPTQGFGQTPDHNSKKPVPIPADAIIKTGSLLSNSAYLAIYNRAHDASIWP